MSRLRALAALTSIIAAALAATAVAIAQTGTRAAAARPAASTAAAATAGSQARHGQPAHFRGRVTSAKRSQRWFRMRTTSNRSVRIYTTRATRWNDCDWGDIHHGHYIDVRARRSHGHWVASRMSNWEHHDDSDDDHDGDDHDGDDHDSHMMR